MKCTEIRYVYKRGQYLEYNSYLSCMNPQKYCMHPYTCMESTRLSHLSWFLVHLIGQKLQVFTFSLQLICLLFRKEKIFAGSKTPSAHNLDVCCLQVGSMQTTTCNIFCRKQNGIQGQSSVAANITMSERSKREHKYLSYAFTGMKVFHSIWNRMDTQKLFWV